MRSKSHFVIQERDLRILRGFLEARVMTQRHVSELFFSGREQAAKKRLQKLKSAGILAERRRKTFDRAVLFLTKAALVVLRDRGILSEYPPLTLEAHAKRIQVSDRTIQHELEIMNVKAALCSALADTDGVSIAEFTTWPQLSQFECAPFGAQLTVKPDGFIRILKADGSALYFYLELDRSTETLATLLLRANCYLAHFKSGGFTARIGALRSDYRKHPFRVLFVLKSEERRNNVAEALINNNPPILSQIWLTTLDAITRDPLGEIWMRPLDYRDALAGTLFDPSRRLIRRGYERQTTRDARVVLRARKYRLFSTAGNAATSSEASQASAYRQS